MVRIAWFENGLVTGRRALAGGSTSLADCSCTLVFREILASEQPEEVVCRNSHKTASIRVSFGRLYEGSPEGSGAGPGEPNSWLTRKWILAPFGSQNVRQRRPQTICSTSSGQGPASALRPAASQRQDAELSSREDRRRTSSGEWALDDRTSAPTLPVTFRIRWLGCPNDGNELSWRRDLRGRASRRRDPFIPGFEILPTVGAQKEGTDR